MFSFGSPFLQKGFGGGKRKLQDAELYGTTKVRGKLNFPEIAAFKYLRTTESGDVEGVDGSVVVPTDLNVNSLTAATTVNAPNINTTGNLSVLSYSTAATAYPIRLRNSNPSADTGVGLSFVSNVGGVQTEKRLDLYGNVFTFNAPVSSISSLEAPVGILTQNSAGSNPTPLILQNINTTAESNVGILFSSRNQTGTDFIEGKIIYEDIDGFNFNRLVTCSPRDPPNEVIFPLVLRNSNAAGGSNVGMEFHADNAWDPSVIGKFWFEGDSQSFYLDHAFKANGITSGLAGTYAGFYGSHIETFNNVNRLTVNGAGDQSVLELSNIGLAANSCSRLIMKSRNLGGSATTQGQIVYRDSYFDSDRQLRVTQDAPGSAFRGISLVNENVTASSGAEIFFSGRNATGSAVSNATISYQAFTGGLAGGNRIRSSVPLQAPSFSTGRHSLVANDNLMQWQANRVDGAYPEPLNRCGFFKVDTSPSYWSVTLGGNPSVGAGIADRFQFNHNEFFPSQHHAIPCGLAGNAWSAIYSQTDLIITSDERYKKEITPLGLGLDFIDGLKPVCFKFIDGTSGRKHCGLLAQDLKKYLEEKQIDTQDFAAFVENRAVKKPLEDQEESTKVDQAAYDNLAIRYGEFIPIMIKAIQELKTKVGDLEAALLL